jgi:hypothetical protein
MSAPNVIMTIEGLKSRASPHRVLIAAVWADNLEDEFKKIRNMVEVCPYVAMVRIINIALRLTCRFLPLAISL